MDIAQLLDTCRGEHSKRELARSLGISERMVTSLYSGERKAGRRVIEALLRRFPERRAEIVEAFFASESHNSAMNSTIELVCEEDVA